jgi:hypothetical protein
VLTAVVKKDSKHVTLDYTISGADVMQSLGLNIYQSDQTTKDSTSSTLGQPSIPAADLNQGSHEVNLILDTAIIQDLSNPYIVVVADADGSIQEASGSVNVISVLNLVTPAEIRAAYGIDQLSWDGAGQTIAIVVAYDDSKLYADVQAFDAQFGLTPFGDNGPTLAVMDESGNAATVNGNPVSPPVTLPGQDPGTQSGVAGAWEAEEAQDVEWAHAIAPGSNIDVVECKSENIFDLFAGVSAADGLATGYHTVPNVPRVSVVSMSWGVSEFQDETSNSFEDLFSVPGVTYLAGAGDKGLPGAYPAYSPKVVAVGGTSLTLDKNDSYLSEKGWSNGGGGISKFEKQPPYQVATPIYDGTTIVDPKGKRAIPDVSFDADKKTGVYEYDSFNAASNGGTSWAVGKGTSLGTPCWAGLIAIVNQGRAQAKSPLPPLNGSTQALPALYTFSGDFHDITSGNNGSSAGQGYDLITGLGTPIANLLVPALVDYAAPTNTTVMSTANPSLNSQKVAFTATVMSEILGSGSPTGTVQFIVDGTNWGSPVALSGGPVTSQGFSTGMATSQPIALAATGKNHTVTVQYVNSDGGFIGSSASLANGQQVNAVTTGNLQNVITQSLQSGNPITFQVDPTQLGSFTTILTAANGLQPPGAPITLTADLQGGTYSDQIVSPPLNLTLVIQNGTLVGSSPALIVEPSQGQVVVQDVTLSTSTDSSTIEVLGGSLTLRNDIVQESTGGSDAAIALTGGTLDLGTADSPGNNTINVNGTGTLIQNTTGSPIPAVGDTFENNGLVAPSIFVLNPTVDGALTMTGNASINIPGPIVIESSSKKAISASASALPNASATGVSVPDPLGGLPALSSTASPVSFSLSGNSSQTINPGVYSQINVSGNAVLTMNPGIYIIAGGGFTVTGNASVVTGTVSSPDTGMGVTIYNAGSNVVSGSSGTTVYGGITLSGSGSFSLIGATTGPYAGVLIFQARDNTRALSFSGNAMLGTVGTIYAPNALLSLSGNAQLQSSLVVGTLNLSGSAALTQMAAGSDGPSDTSGIANTLLAGDLSVYINDPSGLFTANELARIQEAINAWDTVLAPDNVTITEVNDPTLANIVLDTGTTSACGGAANGVLGCYNVANSEITLIQGWNWYTAADPTQISAGQYDFETTVLHELGHALGLGGSTNPSSPMYEALPSGVANRTVTTQDLNIPDPPAGADPLTAVGFAFVPAATPFFQSVTVSVPNSGPNPSPIGLAPLPSAGIMTSSFPTGLMAQPLAGFMVQLTLGSQSSAVTSLVTQGVSVYEEHGLLSEFPSISTDVTSPLDPAENPAETMALPIVHWKTDPVDSVVFRETERMSRNVPGLAELRIGLVYDQILEELAAELVPMQERAEEATAGIPAISLDGTPDTETGHRQTFSQGNWFAPTSTDLTRPDDSPPQLAVFGTQLATILLAAGLCGYGAGTLKAGNQQVCRPPHRRRFPRFRPRTV